jgi:hypothetical protein
VGFKAREQAIAAVRLLSVHAKVVVGSALSAPSKAGAAKIEGPGG